MCQRDNECGFALISTMLALVIMVGVSVEIARMQENNATIAKINSFVDDSIYFSSKIKDVYIDGDYSKLTTQKMILSGAMPADNTRTVNGLTGVYNVFGGKVYFLPAKVNQVSYFKIITDGIPENVCTRIIVKSELFFSQVFLCSNHTGVNCQLLPSSNTTAGILNIARLCNGNKASQLIFYNN